MKKFLSPVAKATVGNKFGWQLCKYILRFGDWLQYERSLHDHKIAEQKLRDLFFDLKVRDGFFKDLKYPSFKSVGSALFPKFSGSYESELFNTLQKLKKNDYKCIIDIGCAEGYYAIGLARKFPDATSIAFDIDESARNLCKEMAVLNRVDERIIIKEACTAKWLKNLDEYSRNIIISDCEGFERHLFNEENISSLKNSDLIIELHPFYEIDVQEFLSGLFSNSHNIELISSYDTKRKLFNLQDEYKQLSEIEKIKLIEEGRPFTMDWLIITVKNKSVSH